MMTLIDGKRLASIRQFADSAFTIINDAQRESILSNIFEPINILGAANTNNFVSYLATILPDGSLVDYSEPWDFQFYGSLIFKENQEVFVYHDSLNKTISTIVTVPPPEGTFESHGFILDNPPLKKKAIVSTKPLNLYAKSITPDYNELLKQEKNLANGESYHDYKIIAKLDLDNDGVNELIFQEVGYESVRYSIYKFFDSMWQVVYRGG